MVWTEEDTELNLNRCGEVSGSIRVVSSTKDAWGHGVIFRDAPCATSFPITRIECIVHVRLFVCLLICSDQLERYIGASCVYLQFPTSTSAMTSSYTAFYD